MLNEELHSYIEGLISERSSLLMEMEEFAHKNNIPIMELTGIEAMLQLLRIQQAKKILEVGTAIGYSALRMAEALPDAHIVTIERDEERSLLAEGYIGRSGFSSRISIIKGDALEAGETAGEMGPFDAIFIDAAKGQYKKFFEIYSAFLHQDGMVITDNVLFKGMVAARDTIESKNLRNLVRKIDDYNRWLMSHPGYFTVILPVGDGVAISKRRGDRK